MSLWSPGVTLFSTLWANGLEGLYMQIDYTALLNQGSGKK